MYIFMYIVSCKNGCCSRNAQICNKINALEALVTSTNGTRGALGATTPTFRVWSSCIHAHTFKAQI